MYPAEIEIKTESYTSASYFDLLLSIGGGGAVSCTLPFTTNVTILTSISQTFISQVATFHLRQPKTFLSHTVCQGLLLI